MRIETKQTGVDQREVALFDESELMVSPARQCEAAIKVGVPRLVSPQRDQIELRACDLDSLLAVDHAAGTVWAFVQSLDLAPFYVRIRSLEGSAGRPGIDPAILVALWLWATVDGVDSAREVDRLWERDNAYRWLCGGVGVHHHTLADFRTEHCAWLDAQLWCLLYS
jgi:transposase